MPIKSVVTIKINSMKEFLEKKKENHWLQKYIKSQSEFNKKCFEKICEYISNNDLTYCNKIHASILQYNSPEIIKFLLLKTLEDNKSNEKSAVEKSETDIDNSIQEENLNITSQAIFNVIIKESTILQKLLNFLFYSTGNKQDKINFLCKQVCKKVVEKDKVNLSEIIHLYYEINSLEDKFKKLTLIHKIIFQECFAYKIKEFLYVKQDIFFAIFFIEIAIDKLFIEYKLTLQKNIEKYGSSIPLIKSLFNLEINQNNSFDKICNNEQISFEEINKKHKIEINRIEKQQQERNKFLELESQERNNLFKLYDKKMTIIQKIKTTHAQEIINRNIILNYYFNQTITIVLMQEESKRNTISMLYEKERENIENDYKLDLSIIKIISVIQNLEKKLNNFTEKLENNSTIQKRTQSYIAKFSTDIQRIEKIKHDNQEILDYLQSFKNNLRSLQEKWHEKTAADKRESIKQLDDIILECKSLIKDFNLQININDKQQIINIIYEKINYLITLLNKLSLKITPIKIKKTPIINLLQSQKCAHNSQNKQKQRCR